MAGNPRKPSPVQKPISNPPSLSFKNSWDEWVPESRMMKLTPENLLKNEDLKSSAQKAKKAGGGGSGQHEKKMAAVESVVAAAAKEKKRRRESMLEKVRCLVLHHHLYYYHLHTYTHHI